MRQNGKEGAKNQSKKRKNLDTGANANVSKKLKNDTRQKIEKEAHVSQQSDSSDVELSQIDAIMQQRRMKQEQELFGLTITKEETHFMKKWFNKKFLPIENSMIDLWISNAQELLDIDEMTEGEIIQEKLDFNNFMSKIFEKYMQVALIEMAAQINSELTKLSDNYFYELPVSALKNMDNCNLFQNFVESDLRIEVMRALKLKSLTNIIIEEIDEEYLKDLDEGKIYDKMFMEKMELFIEEELPTMIVTGILKKSDENTNTVNEEGIYDSILNKLKPNSKWGLQETYKYVSESLKIYEDQIELLKDIVDGRLAELNELALEESEAIALQEKQVQKEEAKDQSKKKPQLKNENIQQVLDNFFQNQDNQLKKFDHLAQDKKIYNKKVQKRAENILDRQQIYKQDEDDLDDEDNEDYDGTADTQNLLENSQRPIAVLEYLDESSEEDSEGDKIEFIPRKKLAAYKEDKNKELKHRAGNPFKFTEGTDPLIKDKIKFLVDETISCPQFIPMSEEESIVSQYAIQASIINSEIPLQEYVKKEHYYNSFKAFTKAVSADPALIKVEIQKKLKYFDSLYSMQKTPEEEQIDMKFTVGLYQRFCAIFYLQSKKLLEDAVFIMKQDKKKLMQPRHILTSAVLNNIIPRSQITEQMLSPQKQQQLDDFILKRKQDQVLEQQKRKIQNAGQKNKKGKAKGQKGRK